MNDPEGLGELRRVRHAMSEAMDHDPEKLLAYFAPLQEELRGQLVNFTGAASPLGVPTGDELIADAWDRQMERDAADGKLDSLAREARESYRRGESTPLPGTEDA